MLKSSTRSSNAAFNMSMGVAALALGLAFIGPVPDVVSGYLLVAIGLVGIITGAIGFFTKK